jgi:GT2 family glycosyltransferase
MHNQNEIKIFNISISIVVYKPALPVLSKAFTHLFASSGTVSISIFVVDNSCDEEWHMKIKKLIDNLDSPKNMKIKLIKSYGNIGYGGANNLVLDNIDSNYHIVMNPDVFVYPDTINKAVEYMQDNQEVALLSPAVFFENGERQWLCKRNPTLWVMFLRSFAPSFIKKIFKKEMDLYEMKDKNPDEPFKDIFFPTGCFMFFRTAIFKQLNGFDPKFFMYYEDADIGRRVLKISHSAYVPSVKIMHQWARGTRTNWRLRWATIKSGMIYFRKWGGLF